jgi:organic radical activating enzyme
VKKLMKILKNNPDKILINELYPCREGEGSTQGSLVFLIRLAGCNLKCWWCDTKEALSRSNGKWYARVKLLETVLDSGCGWVSISGGEPFARGQNELKVLAKLCRDFKKHGLKVKIETNGLVFPKEFLEIVDLWSVSPKWDIRSAKENKMRYNLEVLKKFALFCPGVGLQFKFVITVKNNHQPELADLIEAGKIIKTCSSRSEFSVFLIPQAGLTRTVQIKRLKLLEKELFNVRRWPLLRLARIQTQTHRLLHGNAPGV